MLQYFQKFRGVIIMQKQTKNIITREWLEKELYFYNTAALRTHAVICATVSFLLLPIIILCVVGLCNSIYNVFFKLLLFKVNLNFSFIAYQYPLISNKIKFLYSLMSKIHSITFSSFVKESFR